MRDLQILKDSDYANKGIRIKNDPLGLPSLEARRAFDELTLDVIVPKINEIIGVLNQFSGNIWGFNVTDENVFQLTLNGTDFISDFKVAGREILDSSGKTYPTRFKIKFNNTVVTDEGDMTVISGIKGDKGDTGDKGQDGYSGVIKDDTTGSLYHLGVENGLLYIEEAI